MTPKIVMFTMEILEKEAEKAAGEEGDAVDSHNKLEDMIKELGTALTCKIHQDYCSLQSNEASDFELFEKTSKTWFYKLPAAIFPIFYKKK